MFLIRNALALTFALAMAGIAQAADSGIPEPPKLFFGYMDNMRLTKLARAALHTDPVLAPLRLGVVVENGVAEVSGPSPSEEINKRIVSKLTALPGIITVKHHLTAQLKTDPIPQRPDLPPTLSVQGPPPPPPEMRVAKLPPVIKEEQKTPLKGIISKGIENKPGIPVVKASIHDPPPPPPPQPPVQMPRTREQDPVERLRNSRAEYKSLSVERRGNLVRVAPGSGRAEHAIAFVKTLTDNSIPAFYASQ